MLADAFTPMSKAEVREFVLDENLLEDVCFLLNTPADMQVGVTPYQAFVSLGPARARYNELLTKMAELDDYMASVRVIGAIVGMSYENRHFSQQSPMFAFRSVQNKQTDTELHISFEERHVFVISTVRLGQGLVILKFRFHKDSFLAAPPRSFGFTDIDVLAGGMT